jgi:PhzF family phenazine biosynthesis protein
MHVRLLQVDAFTERPFAGNPAAVCLLSHERDAAWMQDVAREMNLSETAFLLPSADAFRLRWFTPAVEVELCGHATLASAHALWEEGILAPAETARFLTASGTLTAVRRDGLIEMDFPAKEEQAAEAPDGLAGALGVTPRYVGRNQFDYLVLVDDEQSVRDIEPDHRTLRGLGVRGVIVTAAGGESGYDFISRFFAPGSGVDEDPVTGSAHCCLAPFWASRLGKTKMTGYQASARGGVVRVRLAGDRVHLAGSAVTVLRGDLVV